MVDPTLKVIADNPVLFDALLKYLIGEFDDMGNIKVSDSNEMLGQILKARLVGKEVLRESFKKISQLKTTSEQPIKRNEAR